MQVCQVWHVQGANLDGELPIILLCQDFGCVSLAHLWPRHLWELCSDYANVALLRQARGEPLLSVGKTLGARIEVRDKVHYDIHVNAYFTFYIVSMTFCANSSGIAAPGRAICI